MKHDTTLMTKAQQMKAHNTAASILDEAEKRADEVFMRKDERPSKYVNYESDWYMTFVRGGIEYEVSVHARRST